MARSSQEEGAIAYCHNARRLSLRPNSARTRRMPDLNVILAIVVAIGSAVMVVWRGGIQVGKVEAIIQRLEGFETRLHKLNELDTKVETMTRTIEHVRSDHRELKAQVEKIDSREWERTGRFHFPPPKE